MPIRPRSGRRQVLRQRKSCSSSSMLGCLKRVHLAARRIDSGHNVANHSVLPRRIHALKYQQQGIPVGGVVKLLERTELRHVLLHESLKVRLGLVAGLHRGGPLREFYLVPGLHPEIFGSDFHRFQQPSRLSPDSDYAPIFGASLFRVFVRGISASAGLAAFRSDS